MTAVDFCPVGALPYYEEFLSLARAKHGVSGWNYLFDSRSVSWSRCRDNLPLVAEQFDRDSVGD
jgi:hypothetical protein